MLLRFTHPSFRLWIDSWYFGVNGTRRVGSLGLKGLRLFAESSLQLIRQLLLPFAARLSGRQPLTPCQRISKNDLIPEASRSTGGHIATSRSCPSANVRSVDHGTVPKTPPNPHRFSLLLRSRTVQRKLGSPCPSFVSKASACRASPAAAGALPSSGRGLTLRVLRRLSLESSCSCPCPYVSPTPALRLPRLLLPLLVLQ